MIGDETILWISVRMDELETRRKYLTRITTSASAQREADVLMRQMETLGKSRDHIVEARLEGKLGQ